MLTSSRRPLRENKNSPIALSILPRANGLIFLGELRLAKAQSGFLELFFVRGGNVNSGSLNNSANNGNYWSSTANSATNAADFCFYSGGVNSSDYSNRNYGFSVRCLAHKQTQTLTIKDQSDDSVVATYDFETSYKLPEAPAKEGYNFLGYDENKTTTTPTYNPGDLID